MLMKKHILAIIGAAALSMSAAAFAADGPFEALIREKAAGMTPVQSPAPADTRSFAQDDPKKAGLDYSQYFLSGSKYYWTTQTGPGSDYYWKTQTGPGSKYYWNTQTGPGSKEVVFLSICMGLSGDGKPFPEVCAIYPASKNTK